MSESTALTQHSRIEAAAAIADEAAARTNVDRYLRGKAENTRKAQEQDLEAFAAFLAAVTGEQPDLSQVDAWRPVTHGLVAAFVEQQLHDGYAIATIARQLSTVKKRANLAYQAGALTFEQHALIRAVSSPTGTEGKRIDAQRTVTRRSTKKPEAVTLTPSQVAALKVQPDTPQGRRDAVVITLLLELGLRVGELCALRVESFDGDLVKVQRRKVDKVQTHRLTPDALAAVQRWLATDAPKTGPLLRGSRKGGSLTHAGLTERAAYDVVQRCGAAIGVDDLSPHDLRHTWATRAASSSNVFALRDAGGWASLDMPNRYVAANAIANEGIKLRY